MKNIYFVQVGVDFGNTVYIPYAAGAIIASCLSDPEVANEYSFPLIVYTREKLAQAFAKLVDPYMVAFSCNIWNIEYNKALAKMIKQTYPECFVVFGGHSVGNVTSLLEEEAEIDILTFGEGEPVFPQLLKQLAKGDLQQVDSIAYRKDGAIVRTPSRSVSSSCLLSSAK